MDIKLLEQLGLTQGEVKTYLALLKTGISSTGKIAKESGVSRSKLYHILDKLEKKGMVSHVEIKGVINFQASDPKKIKDYIKEKEESLNKLKIDFDNFLPKLESLQKQEKVEKVRFYQGFKGLQAANENIYSKLKRGDEFYYVGIPKTQPESHHLYWNRDLKRASKLGIKSKCLFNKDTPINLIKNRNSFKYMDARYMPMDTKTPSYFLVYSDTVMIAIPSINPVVIEIVSQEIADSFLIYAKEFWKRSKKIKK
jgi:sugar-specific transcriptional regulator TrmB